MGSDRPAADDRWWGEICDLDFQEYSRKATEYGSADLEIMGEAMRQLVQDEDADGEEMAIAFYLLGKVARMFGAYAKGQEPSDDTLHDLTVYSMMARWGREVRRTDRQVQVVKVNKE